MKDKSTAKPASGKPKKNGWEKPYRDFPLSYHPPSGRLYKKIKGHRYYFGKSTDWQSALDKFQRERDDLYAGRKPRPATPDALTVEDLCNHFMESKENKLNGGELSQRTYDDYLRVGHLVIDQFGKRRAVEDLRPDDWAAFRVKLAKTRSPVSLGNQLNRIRVVFNHAIRNDLIAGRIRYGSSFDRPSKKTLRLERAKNGSKMFEADEIEQLLKAGNEQMQAMILLACNGGLGNSDIGNMRMTHLDLDGGWLDYPRVKTGIERRIPLWPRTVEALRQVIAKRREPKNAEDKDLVFVTRCGEPWSKHQTTVSHEFAKLVKSVDQVNAKTAAKNKMPPPTKLQKNRRGYYALRHVFQTVADEAKDPVATQSIMGHADASMSAVYRERVSDERLRAVVNHVHSWLFTAEGGQQ